MPPEKTPDTHPSKEAVTKMLKAELLDSGKVSIIHPRSFVVPKIKKTDLFGNEPDTILSICKELAEWLSVPYLTDNFPSTIEGDAARQQWKEDIAQKVKAVHGEEIGREIFYNFLEKNKLRHNYIALPAMLIATLRNHLSTIGKKELADKIRELFTEGKKQAMADDYRFQTTDEKIHRVQRLEDAVLTVLEEISRYAASAH